MRISKITLANERENIIRDCFVEKKVDFKYPNDADVDDLLD